MGAVIFDVDGTLVDLFDLHLRMFQEVLSERIGLSFTTEYLRRHYGKTGEEIIRLFLAERGYKRADVHALAVERRSMVIAALNRGGACEVLPGVRRLLDELKAQGVAMAVGSSNTPDLGDAIMKSCGLGEYFSACSYKGPDVTGKPAPDIFLNAARMLDIPATDCVVVEDSVYGVAAAKAAGVRVIAVATGEHSRSELAACEPDMLVDTLEEVDFKRINVLFGAGK